MIRVMFKCIGKSSRVDDKGSTTWTITFRRAYGEDGLFFKLKTMNQDVADEYRENKEYPFTIKEDGELGGVFGGVNCFPSNQESQALTNAEIREDEETEETLEEQVARITRAIMDKDGPEMTIDEFVEKVSAEIEVENGCAPDVPLRPMVDAAVLAYQAERRRARIRELAEERLATEDAEELVKIVFFKMHTDEHGYLTVQLGGEEHEEIRREVELLLAERAARAAGEEPAAPAEEAPAAEAPIDEPAPAREASGDKAAHRQKVAKLLKEIIADIPKDETYAFDDLVWDVADALDPNSELTRDQFADLRKQITPLVADILRTEEVKAPGLDRETLPAEESAPAEAAEETGRDPAAGQSEAVHWIFHCSVSDVNWDTAKGRLTDEELLYCIQNFKGKTGLIKLRGEARRRGLAIPGEEQAPAKRRGRPPGSKNKPKAAAAPPAQAITREPGF